MQKGETRGHLWREACCFFVLLFLVVVASLWCKVYLDSKSYFLKAEGVLRGANEASRHGQLIRASELYLSSIRSYAPLNRNNRHALERLLAIGGRLEDSSHVRQAESLYSRTRAALSEASFFYLPHGNVDRELKERLERIARTGGKESTVPSPSGP